MEICECGARHTYPACCVDPVVCTYEEPESLGWDGKAVAPVVPGITSCIIAHLLVFLKRHFAIPFVVQWKTQQMQFILKCVAPLHPPPTPLSPVNIALLSFHTVGFLFFLFSQFTMPMSLS